MFRSHSHYCGSCCRHGPAMSVPPVLGIRNSMILTLLLLQLSCPTQLLMCILRTSDSLSQNNTTIEQAGSSGKYDELHSGFACLQYGPGYQISTLSVFLVSLTPFRQISGYYTCPSN